MEANEGIKTSTLWKFVVLQLIFLVGAFYVYLERDTIIDATRSQNEKQQIYAESNNLTGGSPPTEADIFRTNQIKEFRNSLPYVGVGFRVEYNALTLTYDVLLDDEDQVDNFRNWFNENVNTEYISKNNFRFLKPKA